MQLVRSFLTSLPGLPQDIDAILAGRTEKRQLGSAAGNTFSTATFAAEPAVRPAPAHMLPFPEK